MFFSYSDLVTQHNTNTYTHTSVQGVHLSVIVPLRGPDHKRIPMKFTIRKIKHMFEHILEPQPFTCVHYTHSGRLYSIFMSQQFALAEAFTPSDLQL